MSALILTVSSGVGPIEARQFVRRLADALEREVEARGLALEGSVVHGPTDAPRSVDLLVFGPRAAVESLLGTHTLVQRSARRGKRDRKRWFAGVTCAASVEEAERIDPTEVRFETCRASGAGGQHVNKTESAVRAVHARSGLSVRIESERSQHRNKRRALEELGRAWRRRLDAARDRTERDRRQRALGVERGAAVVAWALAGDDLIRSELVRSEARQNA